MVRLRAYRLQQYRDPELLAQLLEAGKELAPLTPRQRRRLQKKDWKNW